MIEEKLLSEFEISRELHTGIAVTRFLLHRFEDFLPTDISSGRRRYPSASIEILIRIKEALEKGQSPNQIEETIKKTIFQEEPFLPKNKKNEKRDTQEEPWLRELLTNLGEQQKRLAIAQEKRVQVEEKKALAMENIASVLQELSSRHLANEDLKLSQIALQAARILPLEEDQNPDLQMDLDIDQENQDPFSKNANTISTPAEPQDLSLLLDKAFPHTPLSADSDILDIPQVSDNEQDEEDLNYLSDLDDLGDLIDDMVAEESPETEEPLSPPVEIDDLSRLLDDAPETTDHEPGHDAGTRDNMVPVDELSALIDHDHPATESDSIELDDLSKLLTPEEQSLSSTESTPAPLVSKDMDDLSRLLDPSDMDNAKPLTSEKAQDIPMDDLSRLIDPPESLKPSITPEQDMEAYKAAVIDIIIKQKDKGLTPEQTAARMNQDDVQTISGKPRWSVKAVNQIYKFIDASK